MSFSVSASLFTLPSMAGLSLSWFTMVYFGAVVVAVIVAALGFGVVSLIILLAIYIVPVKWRPVVYPHILAVPVAIAAIPGRKAIGIQPLPVLREDVYFPLHIVIHTLLRQIVVAIVAAVPLFLYNGPAHVYAYLRLRTVCGRNAEKHRGN